MIKGVFMDFNEEKEAIWPGSEAVSFGRGMLKPLIKDGEIGVIKKLSRMNGKRM